MLGLGETQEEIHQTLKDLRSVACDIVTFGQYLRPQARHLPVENTSLQMNSTNGKKKLFPMGFYM